MVLPLVPVVIMVVSGVTGSSGIAAGVVGGVQIRRARVEMTSNKARYERRYAVHLNERDRTNKTLRDLGTLQERALYDVIYRMRDFLERHAKQVRANEHLILDGVDGTNNHVVGMARLDPDVVGWVKGVVGSGLAGALTQAGLRSAVGRYAAASTGTAIATLQGAAAESATLAFLGGGSLAAGGGGVALGATMLNVAVAGPSVLVAGLTVKNRGTKAKTEAAKLRALVDLAMADLDERDQVFQGICQRARELELILSQLMTDATAALDLLESEPFDVNRHGARLQRGLMLVKAVRDVATAPVLDENGNLDLESDQLVLKYRELSRETVDD